MTIKTTFLIAVGFMPVGSFLTAALAMGVETVPPPKAPATSLAIKAPAVAQPAWAAASGTDQYGTWADLTVTGVTQRFRWIQPGTFTMGPTKEEKDIAIKSGLYPDGIDHEVQHQVTLTQGYWLADSACTQALWQAITGKNPSEIKISPQHPVERVSWIQCQEFLAKLNAQVPGGGFRLPSEAQWEYACRAGTTTAFSFGSTITTEQVNFNSEIKDPFGQATKAGPRKPTVPVKSLPPNPWGLYEMHGNVWQWCQDWMGLFPGKAEQDPTGPTSGFARAFRGGSWYSPAGTARSASRGGFTPDGEFAFLGFRFASGGSSPVSGTITAFEAQAQAGNAEAQYQLGLAYRHGKEVEKNLQQAADWLRKAAEQGHAAAQFSLGQYYANGGNVEIDPRFAVKAVDWYRKAVEQAEGSFLVEPGDGHFSRGSVREGNMRQAVAWYRKAAGQGHADSLVYLGWHYVEGEGVGKDPKQALEWFRKAADQGVASAQFRIAVALAMGEGVEKDMKQSFEWCRKAAEQGYATAQRSLGYVYANGEGVEKDDAKAIEWYRKAAEHGDSRAQFSLGQHHELGKGTGKDMKTAIEWYQKAAEQDDFEAHIRLGECYARGEGVPKDPVMAGMWFTIATMLYQNPEVMEMAEAAKKALTAGQRDEVRKKVSECLLQRHLKKQAMSAVGTR